MDLTVISNIPKDTLSVIDASQVAAFYADIIEQQQAQFNIFLVALGVVIAAVLGATWWWNYRGSKAQITDEIQDGIKSLQGEFNTHKSATEGLINSKVNEQMEALSATMNKELESFKAKIENNNQKMNADLCRVFALHCSTEGSFFNSAKWWLSAFDGYAAINDGRFEQIAINACVTALQNSVKKEEILSDHQIDSLEDVKNKIEKIPDVFAKQRSEAKKLTKKLVEIVKKRDKEDVE